MPEPEEEGEEKPPEHKRWELIEKAAARDDAIKRRNMEAMAKKEQEEKQRKEQRYMRLKKHVELAGIHTLP